MRKQVQLNGWWFYFELCFQEVWALKSYGCRGNRNQKLDLTELLREAHIKFKLKAQIIVLDSKLAAIWDLINFKVKFMLRRQLSRLPAGNLDKHFKSTRTMRNFPLTHDSWDFLFFHGDFHKTFESHTNHPFPRRKLSSIQVKSQSHDKLPWN